MIQQDPGRTSLELVSKRLSAVFMFSRLNSDINEDPGILEIWTLLSAGRTPDVLGFYFTI